MKHVETMDTNNNKGGSRSQRNSDISTSRKSKGRNNRRKGSNKEGSQTNKSFEEQFAPRFAKGKTQGKACNDISWYNAHGALERDGYHILYSQPTGAVLDLPKLDGVNEDFGCSVPGCMQINYIPVYGTSGTKNDPMNIAAQSMFIHMTHAISRSTMKYDAVDIMQYAICLDSISYYISWLTRLFGEVALYNQQNNYLPESIFDLQYVDLDDVRDNYADFKSRINIAIEMANKVLKLPANMPIFERHAKMISNIYCEDSNPNSQLYWYNPEGWYALGFDDDNKPVCRFNHFRTAFTKPMDTNDLASLLEGMIEQIYANQDWMEMAGHIEKVYGTSNLINFAFIPEFPVLSPVLNYEVLEQIKNTKTYNFNIRKSHVQANFDVKQDDTVGYLVQEVAYQISDSDDAVLPFIKEMYCRPVLITTVGDGSSQSTMINTRNVTIPVGNYSADTHTLTLKMNCGSEFFTSVNIAIRKSNRDIRNLTAYGCNFIQTWSGDDTINTLQILSALANFKYAPQMQVCILHNGNGTAWAKSMYYSGLNWDVDNYCVLDEYLLRKYHRIAIYSEFIPEDSIIKPYGNY